MSEQKRSKITLENMPENMSGRECIYHAIGYYKTTHPKLYRSQEECLAKVIGCLRVNGQDSESNIDLAEKEVKERLDC
jgi:predicted lipoprotein